MSKATGSHLISFIASAESKVVVLEPGDERSGSCSVNGILQYEKQKCTWILQGVQALVQGV